MSELKRVARRKRALQWPVVLWLTAAWVLLWGELSVGNVLSGLIVAVVVILVFPLPPIAFNGRFRPVGLFRLVARFYIDLALASLDVARLALRIGKQPKSSVIRVDLRARSDLYMVLTAELLSLIPGSVVVEADRSSWTLYLHVLGAETSDDIERARRTALQQEGRLIRAFGSDAELADYARAAREGRPQ
ncbi:Na+/H+ antiporter subunit E [Phytoactinopolyspora alkaliphila]|uniref:Na+/H+ antiporter subunit E n=1 Tax=Phytoactinopolyspora alkaliphila TaxID=1783498 RepID=A0A6N9YJH3_9ACTN|nr:Na+/H+ antiporter subunit E [Phytoactinopolyspora alkaliphila]NED95048.1 Na+/H+ antiporter subunit E [Phytoactinopolyspora alkaliphila]